MCRFILIFWGAAWLIPGSGNGQNSGWELQKDKDGIKVYTRLTEGAGIKEFKAEGILQVGAEQIFAVLQDIENYPSWLQDVEFAKRISTHNNGLTLYYQLDLPWPVKDRDMVLDMDITHTSDSIILKLGSNAHSVPANDDYIRMHRVTGYWSLYPVTANSTRVTHQFLADPEGSIPNWLINAFIVDGPYENMINLAIFAASYKGK